MIVLGEECYISQKTTKKKADGKDELFAHIGICLLIRLVEKAVPNIEKIMLVMIRHVNFRHDMS
jgi:hypothetical protein